MPTLRLFNALHLLEQPADAAELRTESPGVGLLDLRGITSPSSIDRGLLVYRVAEQFAKRTAAGRPLTLMVAAGRMTPEEAAGRVSAALLQHGQPTALVAVVRGESVSSAVESWHAQGEALRKQETGERLIDATQPLLDVYAPAEFEAVHKAAAKGARVVITCFADPGTLALAGALAQAGWKTLSEETRCAIGSAGETLLANFPRPKQVVLNDEGTPEIDGQPLDLSSPPWKVAGLRRPIIAWLAVHRRLHTSFPFASSQAAKKAETQCTGFAESCGVRLATHVVASFPKGEPTSREAALVIDAEAKEETALSHFADLLATLFVQPNGLCLQGPATRELQQRVLRVWHSDVSRDLLEYAVDARSAADW